MTKQPSNSTFLLYLQVDGLEGISYTSVAMLSGHLKRQASANNIKGISTYDRSHSFGRSVNTEEHTQHQLILLTLPFVHLKTKKGYFFSSKWVANITHLP